MRDFSGKVAVITGGASGVGRALAAALVGEGARVVIADLDAAALASTRDALAAAGGDVLAVGVDVTRAESVQALADRVFAERGAVHLLFNNAGVGVREAKRRLWTLPDEDWQWAYAVNVFGVVHGIRAFVPRMLAAGEEGHVVNTTSGNGGVAPLPTTPIYASSKAAVTSLTEVLHLQLLAEGARLQAHALFPGPHLVNTGILNSERVRPPELRAPGEAPAPYVDMAALARSAGVGLELTEPEEVAAMALEGIREGRFWILSRAGKSDAALEARTRSIRERENPRLP